MNYLTLGHDYVTGPILHALASDPTIVVQNRVDEPISVFYILPNVFLFVHKRDRFSVDTAYYPIGSLKTCENICV